MYNDFAYKRLFKQLSREWELWELMYQDTQVIMKVKAMNIFTFIWI